jgi:hypothetical protein
MVHSGFEASAVIDSIRPAEGDGAAEQGPKTEGEMAPEIDLSNQRKADFVFSRHVEQTMASSSMSRSRCAARSMAAPRRVAAGVAAE